MKLFASSPRIKTEKIEKKKFSFRMADYNTSFEEVKKLAGVSHKAVLSHHPGHVVIEYTNEHDLFLFFRLLKQQHKNPGNKLTDFKDYYVG